MQLIFQREDLLKPLSIVAGVVERRQTLPILSYVLLKQTEGEGLTLTGTDLEVEVVVRVTARKGSVGELTAPARKLLDICRALPEGTEIRMDKEGDKVTVRAGKSRFSLVTLPGADFPAIETSEWEEALSVQEGQLKEVLEATHFCMAQQDVRYYLNGLLLELGGNRLRGVATDGHRMALSDITLEQNFSTERQAIVPRKGVHELIRLLGGGEGPVEVQFGRNHVRVKTGEVTFTAKLIDGRFPDYNKVIPQSQPKRVRLDRVGFREALVRAAILSNEKYRGVRLKLGENTLSITAHNPEQEEAEEEIAAEYGGGELEIGFNVNYLIEAVEGVPVDEVILGLNDASTSCTIGAPERTSPRYVIMPMRL